MFAGGVMAQDEDVPTVGDTRRNSGAGTTAAEFLLLGAGARGVAIGPAYAAIARDVESLYYNPAGLPLMDGIEASVSTMPYFADMSYIWGGLAMPLAGGEYGFGISIANFGFSDAALYSEADPENESEQTYNVSQTMLGLSFAHAFIDRFSGGFTLKFISDQLGQTSATAFALDIGTNYHAELAGRPIAMSLVIQNLGTSLKHSGAGLNFQEFPGGDDNTVPSRPVDPSPARWEAASSAIPVVFRVGLSYDVVSAGANRLSLLGEFNEQYNNDPSFGGGAEWAWAPEDGPIAASLRGSYAYQPDNSLSSREEREAGESLSVEDEGMDGLTLGGGLRYNLGESLQVRADYAWRHWGVLGTRNMFTVAFGWR